MKNLSIEEKAKRYDEAIEKLHEIITMDNKPVNPKEMGEYLFPEFKEFNKVVRYESKKKRNERTLSKGSFGMSL